MQRAFLIAGAALQANQRLPATLTAIVGQVEEVTDSIDDPHAMSIGANKTG